MDSGRVILVVEDSDEDFEATLRAFRKTEANRPVRRCVDGEEALDYLLCRGRYAEEGKAPKAALVLLDLNLPGTDGQEVLEQIKANVAIRGTPVVVLTTSSSPIDIDACYHRGASSYIIKPVDFKQLLGTIRQLNEYWFEAVTLPGGPL
ncbi:response regulator [Isosphaeraceae bacterium EP7]